MCADVRYLRARPPRSPGDDVRVLIAPCSFKESLTATAAAGVLARVATTRGWAVDRAPLADGGEGTLDALRAPWRLQLRRARVPNAMGQEVSARLGVGREGVVLEAAEVVGLAQIPRAARDPRRATTTGLGLLLRRALDLGAPHVWIGLGGSATVDGGAGLLHALGARFLDERGRELAPEPRALARLARVDRRGLDPRLARTQLTVLMDVRAPLLGPRGAELFMAQKGVRPRDLPLFRSVLRRLHPGPWTRRAGAGAAGGLGAALFSLGARGVPGIDVVLQAHGVRRRLDDVDLVLTGEGRLDAQTLQGKALAALARECRAARKPLVALCGRVDLPPAALRRAGLIALPIVAGPCSVDEAVAHARANLARAAAATLDLFLARR